MWKLLFLVLLFPTFTTYANCVPSTGVWTIGTSTATLGVCAADGSTVVNIGGGGSLPSGMIAAFNAACPAGWTELIAARGRVIIGVPAAGTLAGTVGTALTDLQDKTHSHTYTDVVNHTHSVTDPGHTHLTQRYPTATGGSSGFTIDTSMSGTLADNTLPTKAGTTGITVGNPAGGVASGTTSTRATSDVIAYIQLRYCTKD